ncbi:MAG: hypothetical protein HY906_28495 [Deltaproteobacteria bacterium]|nr:hypothetical protein [Deltaproteobacteria bacterium]
MRRLRARLLALALVSAWALTATAAPEAAPDAERLKRLADEITAQVVRLRGLPLKRPMPRGVLSRAEIRKKLEERLAKEFPKAAIAAEGMVLKRLGLIPAEADYLKLVLDLLTDQVVGFYDPFQRQLYIADWLPIDMQRPALAHEITHGLQDQHFDLRRFTTGLKGNADRQLARAALVEGDGTGVMLELALGVDLGSLPPGVMAMLKPMLQLFSSPTFQRTPRFLREVLVFPYTAGLDFVATLRRRHAWARINAFYLRPPESTEQVLHPEKFLAAERPVLITPRPLQALKGSREVWQDTLGEAQLRLYLEQHVSKERAATAAAGWGGDRAVAYQAPGRPGVAVVHYSVWDGEQDAIEFEEAQAAALAKLAGQPAQASGPVAYAAEGGLVYGVVRQGSRVVSGYGVPAAAWGGIAAEVQKAWRVK